MRILLTADPELPVPPKLYGGIERVVDLLVRELRAQGHSVGLVAHRESSVDADAFYAWPGLRSQSRMDTLRNSTTLIRSVRSFQPNVVHSFSRLAYLFPLLAGWKLFRLGVPSCVMSYQRQPTERQVHRATQWADGKLTFTGCSEHICHEGRRGGGTWRAIHNCVEMSKYTFQGNVPSDAPLVFLSRVERIKGAHTAIEIARRSGKRLWIAGNHATTGPEKGYWESEVLPHVGRNGVEYLGPVTDEQKNQLLGQAAAMMVPIEWDEPFGIVFAESLACGTPVISCPRGALPEIIRDGVDGFLVKNIEEGVEAVARLPLISREGCRRRAEEHFCSRAIADRYAQLYACLAP